MTVPTAESREQQVLQGLLLGCVAAIPLSIALAEALAYAALAWAAAGLRRREEDWRRCPLFWPVAFFVVVAVLSSLWGFRPAVALARTHRLLMLGLIFPIARWIGAPAGAGRRPGGVALAVAFLAGGSLRALYDAVRIPLAVARGVPLFDAGNMRDPQFYMVALCCLAALGMGLPAVRRAAWWWALAALNLAALVLHCKRGAWIATALALAAMGLAARCRRALLAVLGLALLLLAAPPTRERLWDLQREGSEQWGGRYALWTEVAPAMLRAFPQGVGYGGLRNTDYARVYPGYIDAKLNHLHNNPLEVALETGWLGLAVWLFWMGWAGVRLWRRYRVRRDPPAPDAWVALAAWGAWGGLMVNGLVEYNFGDSEILLLLCWLMGVAGAPLASDSRAAEPVA